MFLYYDIFLGLVLWVRGGFGVCLFLWFEVRVALKCMGLGFGCVRAIFLGSLLILCLEFGVFSRVLKGFYVD